MKTKVLLVLALMAMLSIKSFAQDSEKRFGFELSSGASFATSELNEAKLNPGFGFEGTFHYRFMPHFGTYIGWGWNKLSSENSFAGSNLSFEETGYIFGFQFNHPIGSTPLSYYLRGAGLYNHIELENNDGEIIHDTKHGYGYQVAGGIDVKLGSKWSITPGVKFNSLKRESEYSGKSTDFNLNYLSISIGILKKF